jgi:hypothetical protein
MFPLITVALIESAPASLYDSDAEAVISAIELTGVSLSEAQKTACNNRILAFKSDGIWAKVLGYYGFLGGTAASHAINWKAPGTYDSTWSGAFVHSSTETQGVGAGYGDIGYNPFTGPLTNSIHIAIYSRTNSSADIADFGLDNASLGGTYRQFRMHLKWSDGNCYFDAPLSSRIQAAMPSSQGFICGSIDYSEGGNSDGFITRNGSILTTNTVTSNSVKISDFNKSVWMLGSNNSRQNDSSRSYGSFSFGYALAQAEAIANYASEQAYQTALGRQV